MTGPVVTAVVVTYDGAALLPPCLDSLAEQTLGRDRLHVVVVDNASHDDTLTLLRERYPWVEVVASPRNLGFAGGVDLGLRAASTPWVFLLNSDARAARDCVERLLDAAEHDEHGRVAALVPTLLLSQRYRPAGPHDVPGAVVQGATGRYTADDEGTVRLVNSTGGLVTRDGYGTDRGWLADAASHDPPPDVFGFCGAAVLLRRAAVQAVGGFDPRFFMYYEDADLSWRLRLAGWSVRHVADARADHLHAATSVAGSDLFTLHNDRNRLVMLVKDASAPLALRCVLRAVLTLASTTLRRNEPWSRTRLRWRAFGSFLRLLPHALRARRSAAPPSGPGRHLVERLLAEPPREAVGPR